MFPFGGGPGGPFGGGLFEHMDRMMNAMMADPFFGGTAQHQAPLGYQQEQQQQQHTWVEEVPDDAAGRSSSGPALVEEPGEPAVEYAPQAQYAQQQQQQQQQQYAPGPGAYGAPAGQVPGFPPHPFASPFGGLFGAMLGAGLGAGLLGPPHAPGGGGAAPGQAGGQAPQVYSYSSSSVMRAGPGGVYSETTESRHAPGGVRETQRRVRDGRSGHESLTIARGIGEQERVVSRTRDAEGRLHTHESHRGLDPTAAAGFDQQWTQQAAQAMPSWMQGRQQQGVVGGGGGRQPQLALPGQQQQQQAGWGGGQAQQQQQGSGRWPGGYHV